MKLADRVSTFVLVLCVFCLTACGFAYAQDGAPIPTNDFIQLILASLGGVKGASAIGIASIVVKLLIAAFNSELLGKQLDKMTGKFKLAVISLLSYASGVIALVVAGSSYGAAFVHGSVVPLLVVFINQLYKQFIVKKDEPAKIQS